MVTVEKSGVIGSSTALDLPKFTDIDSDDKDPLLCCLYAPEIYYNLRVSEVIPRLDDIVSKETSNSDFFVLMCHLSPCSLNADRFLTLWRGYRRTSHSPCGGFLLIGLWRLVFSSDAKFCSFFADSDKSLISLIGL